MRVRVAAARKLWYLKLYHIIILNAIQQLFTFCEKRQKIGDFGINNFTRIEENALKNFFEKFEKQSKM